VSNLTWWRTATRCFAWSLALAFFAIAYALSATMASAVENKKIRGCWIKVGSQFQPTRKGQLKPRLEFCFRKDGEILGNYAESDGHAGDLEKQWRGIGRSILNIGADRCTFKSIGNDRFLLTNCIYEGEWRLGCRKPKYPTTCGKFGID